MADLYHGIYITAELVYVQALLLLLYPNMAFKNLLLIVAFLVPALASLTTSALHRRVCFS